VRKILKVIAWFWVLGMATIKEFVRKRLAKAAEYLEPSTQAHKVAAERIEPVSDGKSVVTAETAYEIAMERLLEEAMWRFANGDSIVNGYKN
jgi:hypothetical protein